MSPGTDIETLLHQKQLMDQITNQGTGAAMMGGGANLGQFNTGGRGQGADYTGLPAPRQGGGGLFSSMVPGLSQVEAAKGRMDQGIADMFTPKDPNVHALNYQQAQDPAQRPMLVRPPAQQLQLGPNNQLTMGGQPQFSAARYTPSMLGQ